MKNLDWLDTVRNIDALEGIASLPDSSIDLVVADPPYNLGKDYGNESDKQESKEFLAWTENWLSLVIPKIKQTGSLYIFTTWRYSPEIFVFLKSRMTMINEIIWDRRVPSMGGSTRKYSSVHDTIGFFAKSKDYYFDLDSVRVPYDEETKKARSRSIFVGKKWLEVGYNPKDLWTVSRLHRIHSERENHPTQKPLEIVERIVKASCPENGIVLDPFAGSGTTVAACLLNNRRYVVYEINADYYDIITKRVERIQNGSYNITPISKRNGGYVKPISEKADDNQLSLI
ncbi:MAG: site-specific DNA-methyltransferase [Pyrinomonadaceae bacterium MAG19_C2-C3]|nr:site-specific DNA-methyltransferase [Pyrinomonadaceae bacterium MAG19_C2-C3]